MSDMSDSGETETTSLLVGEHQTDKGKAGAMGDGGVYQRKVVLGVDASEHSERAFNWYLKNMCDKMRDILLIIHARELPTNAAAPYASYGYWYYEEMQNAVERSAQETRELLEVFGNKCRQLGLNFKLYKEQSNKPGEVICRLAKDDKAHAVVVGARGVGTVRRKLLGSVSEYCVHHIHIPLVVVPSPHHHI